MAKKTKKKPVRKQAKKPVKRLARPASRKTRPTRRKAASRAPAKKRTKKTTALKARKAAKPAKSKSVKKARKAPAKAPVKAKAPVRKAAPARKASVKVKPSLPITASSAPVKMPPARLQRERRRLPEAEEESFTEARDDSRLMSAARAGHDELRSEIKRQTANSPAMTAGDVDAKWQDAYALGDEAPGGDNMTPDQDRVDDIGKALGIEYADDEELLGGDELTERDEHRWELDPASKDDDEDL